MHELLPCGHSTGAVTRFENRADEHSTLEQGQPFVQGNSCTKHDRASVSERTWAFQTKSAFSDSCNIVSSRLIRNVELQLSGLAWRAEQQDGRRPDATLARHEILDETYGSTRSRADGACSPDSLPLSRGFFSFRRGPARSMWALERSDQKMQMDEEMSSLRTEAHEVMRQ